MTVVHVETDPLVDAPAGESWWDVHERWTSTQSPYVGPSAGDRTDRA
jgi:TPP-dependent trihydroxycyclohexane-1,2-dione (THcHDO) dehydratase